MAMVESTLEAVAMLLLGMMDTVQMSMTIIERVCRGGWCPSSLCIRGWGEVVRPADQKVTQRYVPTSNRACDLQQKTLWYLEGRPRFVILRRGVCGGGGRTAAALSSNMGAQCDVIDGSRHSRYFSPHPSSNGAPKVGRGEPSPARRADLIDA